MSGGSIARGIMLLAAAACAVFDIRERRIPHAVVLPALAAAAAARLLQEGWRPLAEGLAAGAAAWLLFRLVRAATGGRLGAGDAQLAALIGLALGARLGLAALLIAASAGTVAALVLMACGRLRRGDPLAFGPFLALGAAGALLVEGPLELILG